MPATRTARHKRTSDPVERRLRLRERKASAPAGFVTRPVLCERVGLNASQFRALVTSNVIISDGTNPHGYALYTLDTVERLVAMKRDGSLFRTLSSAEPTSDEASATRHAASMVTAAMHYSAEDGVRVFELLHEGKALEEIILSTRIHPLIVKAIRVDYDDITGSIHLPKSMVEQVNGLGRDGKLAGAFPVRDAADVFAVIELCSIDRTCSTCGQNPAITACEDCLTQERREARAGLPRTG